MTGVPLPGDAPADLVGQSCGPYRLLRELGAGAMGTVFLAEPEDEAGRRVALKMLHPHLMRRKGFFTRFRREAEAGRQVDHPNVVRTYDCDLLLVGGQLRFFLVMEYVEGQTLRELLGQLGVVPEPLLREIALQVTAGLAAIHAEDIVHRDLKPENILLARDQRVRIMDLGIAKVEDTSVAITREDRFAGSLLYVAPEQVRREPVGPAADLYSLGAMLWELATGRNPFAAPSAAGVVYAHLHHEPGLPPGVSPFLAAVIGELLAKAPADRFPGAAALHRTLKEGEESSWWQERREDAGPQGGRGPRIPVRRGTRVYGRERERRALQEEWERARRGPGGLVLVEGEAGIGKTRLVDLFAAAAAREGARVLYGAYAPGGAGDALAESLVQHFGADRLPAELDWLLPDSAALVPAFAALVRQEAGAPGAASLADGALHAVWCRLSRALSDERPLLWIVEDLQFASVEHRRTLWAMHRAAAGARVMLLATSRTPLPKEEAVELGRAGRFRRMPLRRLRSDEVVQMLHEAFRHRELAERLGGRIAEKSDGVPFFVSEMIRALCERRFLSPSSDGRLVEARAIGRIEVPSTVREVLEARLSGLGPGDRDILDVAAVQGFAFDPDVTARVLGLERVTVLQRIALLERRLGIVREREQGCHFDHHLLQELLYDSLLPSLRAEYHAGIAEALAREGAAAEPHSVALHHLRGREPARARPYLAAAVEHLGRRHRHEAKVELAALALENDRDLDPSERVRLLLAKAEALFVLGRRLEREEALRAALAAAERADDQRLAVVLELAEMEAEHGGARIGEALELSAGSGDRAAAARAHGALARLRARQGRLEEASRGFRSAAGLADDAEDRNAEARARTSLAACLLQLGSNEEARHHALRALQASREAGRPLTGVVAMLDLAAAQGRLGDTLAAEELQEQALELAGSIGFRVGEAEAALSLGGTLGQLGRSAGARRAVERALATARECGDRSLEARSLGEMGRLWLRLGRGADALRCHETAQRLHREAGDRVAEQLQRLFLCRLEAEYGRASEARGPAEEAREHLAELQARSAEAHGCFVLGLIAERMGHHGAAGDRYAEAVARHRQMRDRPALAGALLARGRLALEEGSAGDARVWLAEARDAARACTLPNLACLADVWLALLPGGDLAAARASFARQEMRVAHLQRIAASDALWRATGERAYREEAQRLLREARAAAPPAWRDAFAGVRPYDALLRAEGS